MALPIRRHKRYHEPWARCSTCGLDVPKSKIKRHPRWGWQCTGEPGANCYDKGPDRDQQQARYRFPRNEGVRKTKAPLTNTVQEGVDGDVDAGED